MGDQCENDKNLTNRFSSVSLDQKEFFFRLPRVDVSQPIYRIATLPPEFPVTLQP